MEPKTVQEEYEDIIINRRNFLRIAATGAAGFSIYKIFGNILNNTTPTIEMIKHYEPPKSLNNTENTTTEANESKENSSKHIKYIYNLDGVRIIGESEQFIEDILMINRFLEKYAPEYYDIIIKSGIVKTITESTGRKGIVSAPSGARGNISFDQDYLNNCLREEDGLFSQDLKQIVEGEKNNIVRLLQSQAHEWVHSFETRGTEEDYRKLEIELGVQRGNKVESGYDNGENVAAEFGKKVKKTLRYVSQTEIDKFVEEFDFSKYEKDIQNI